VHPQRWRVGELGSPQKKTSCRGCGCRAGQSLPVGVHDAMKGDLNSITHRLPCAVLHYTDSDIVRVGGERDTLPLSVTMVPRTNGQGCCLNPSLEAVDCLREAGVPQLMPCSSANFRGTPTGLLANCSILTKGQGAFLGEEHHDDFLLLKCGGNSACCSTSGTIAETRFGKGQERV
jgi:hypothetical protein